MMNKYQELYNVLKLIITKKLYIQFHLMTKRAIKKGKDKSYKKSMLSYAFNYWLTFAFMPLKYVLNIQQKAIKASQQKTFPKGGVVKGYLKGKLVKSPNDTIIIPNDIAKQIAKNSKNIEVKNINVKFDKKNLDILKDI